ncbi:MAG TPA: hypothetical protein O0X47_05915, partial [Methanocorpusculum sp.]|nr:hypothetical protein [Methanocorpusculum sp.]
LSVVKEALSGITGSVTTIVSLDLVTVAPLEFVAVRVAIYSPGVEYVVCERVCPETSLSPPFAEYLRVRVVAFSTSNLNVTREFTLTSVGFAVNE